MGGGVREGMEMMRIGGYREVEKVEIVKEDVVRKEVKEEGLKKWNVEIGEEAVVGVIGYYRREGGVRNVEWEIAGIWRKGGKVMV